MKALFALSLALAGPAVPLAPPAESSIATRSADGTIHAAAAPGLSPATQYQIGSISKWVCTVAILRHVEAGDYRLDDRLSTLLPSFEGPDDVRLSDLLANRAGLRDGLGPAMERDGQDAILARDESAIEAANIYANGPAISEPGATYSYDLVNWMLVQAILERSGKSLGEVLAVEMFGPDAADLPDTFVLSGELRLDHPSKIRGPSGKLPRWAGCAGGVVSTPTDLLRLLHWTASEGLSQASLAQMLTVRTPEHHYALGGHIRVDEKSGEALFWLSGSNGAYKSRAAYRSSTGEAVATMNSVNDTGRLESVLESWFAAQRD